MSSKPTSVSVSAQGIGVRRAPESSIAVMGIPNAGKSTLFNRLTGLRQRIGNYPGVTVERHVGDLKLGERSLQLVDLPGTHGLSASSMEERVAVDVVLGRVEGMRDPDAVLAVVDASNLYQGLFLVQQLLELGKPVAIALTMMDAARASGLDVDVEALSARLGGVPVLPVVATTGEGIDALCEALFSLPSEAPIAAPMVWPELDAAIEELRADNHVPRVPLIRLLIDGADDHNADIVSALGPRDLNEWRDRLFGGEPPLAAEARVRYNWARDVVAAVQRRGTRVTTWRTRVTHFFNQPVPGTLGLFIVMAIVFQAVFAWATPMMDLIDGTTSWLAGLVGDALGDTMFSSLIADGLISGVGSVIIFLPQIMVLFLFIIVLEDSGYLARAAFLMDRAMRSVGLSGQSVVPMISSFACAVPGIMATRVIPNRRDRIATIIAAPFMTCSARLPVYALLIAAFVPARSVGFFNLQGLVLLGLYLFGIVMGVLTALLLRQTALRGPKPPFALMLPEFRRPNLRTVLIQLLGRARVFLRRAGTVILTVALLVWAAAYFPRSAEVAQHRATSVAAAQAQYSGDELDAAVARIENETAAMQLEQSWLGRAGKGVEPVFKPLGWDWRVSAAVIAGFPAREVVVAILGTVYAVGDEADDATLSGRLEAATWPDGRPIYTLPMVIGLLIFYACCLQCAATLAVMRRETNGWRWPIFAWTYMTLLGYFGAMAAFQLL
ncbi:MAG: ferrous iron transport protein B [Gammaproteobacteria bacterium]